MSNNPGSCEFVSEDNCVVCGRRPEADRSSMRILIDSLPLQEVEQISLHGVSALASGVPNADPCAAGRTRARRGGSRLASRLSGANIVGPSCSATCNSALHCGLPFLGIVFCLGEFCEVAPQLVRRQCRQLAVDQSSGRSPAVSSARRLVLPARPSNDRVY
jgi:hypothetical protein